MKILVLNNNEIDKKNLKHFRKAVDNLKRLGHNLKDDSEFKAKKEKDIVKFQKKIEKSIKDTDIVIAEITNPDAKLGYDIAKAIAEKKIVVALRQEGAKVVETPAIHGNKSKSLLKKEYNAENVLEIVDKAIDEAKKKLDTKFILIISSQIDRYLDWAAQTKRMHKAQIVRNAIEDTMKKDKQYKNYLKG